MDVADHTWHRIVDLVSSDVRPSPADNVLCLLIHRHNRSTCTFYFSYAHTETVRRWKHSDDDADAIIVVLLPIGVVSKIAELRRSYSRHMQYRLCLCTVLLNEYMPVYHNLDSQFVNHRHVCTQNTATYNKTMRILQLASKIDVCRYVPYVHRGDYKRIEVEKKSRNAHADLASSQHPDHGRLLTDEIERAFSSKTYGRAFKLDVSHLMCSVVINEVLTDPVGLAAQLGTKYMWRLFDRAGQADAAQRLRFGRSVPNTADCRADRVHEYVCRNRFTTNEDSRVRVVLYLVQNIGVPKCSLNRELNRDDIDARHADNHGKVKSVLLSILKCQFKKINKPLVYYCNVCRYPYWTGERVLSKKKKYSNRVKAYRRCEDNEQEAEEEIEEDDNEDTVETPGHPASSATTNDLHATLSRKRKNKHMSYIAETVRMKCINGCEQLQGPLMKHQNLVDMSGNSYSVVSTDTNTALSVCQLCRGCKVVVRTPHKQLKYCIECKLVVDELRAMSNVRRVVFYMFVYNTCLMLHWRKDEDREDEEEEEEESKEGRFAKCEGCLAFEKVYASYWGMS